MPSQLGCAYAVKDSDNDGLPDGAEYLLGTSVIHANSDGDSLLDGAEYPFSGVQVSDPCAGPNVRCPRAPSCIFADSFE